jgi:hypothetical protein
MDLLFYITFIAAMLHFIYDGIIAPTIRTKLDHQLFELRDELRNVKIDKRHECEGEAYGIVEDGLNMYIGRVGMVTISFVLWLKTRMSDEGLRKEVWRRTEKLEKANIAELAKIAERGSYVLLRALVFNSLPLIVLVVPLAIAAAIYSYLHKLGVRLFALPLRRTQELIEHSSLVRMRA